MKEVSNEGRKEGMTELIKEGRKK